MPALFAMRQLTVNAVVYVPRVRPPDLRALAMTTASVEPVSKTHVGRHTATTPIRSKLPMVMKPVSIAVAPVSLAPTEKDVMATTTIA